MSVHPSAIGTLVPPGSRTRWSTGLYVALFILLAVLFSASNWPAIATANLELGDFAANSLLIQDAKSLALVHGNYSRVGFNHPGPALLYVLAAGELVFHDLLHVVPSPFSGQLLAVPIYNAAWLVAIFAIVRRSSSSVAGALLFTGALILALALADYNIFAGIWFPHLYVLPFTTMLLAASRLVYARLDSITALGVSTGFLINGHVSFVAICGIVLVCVLLANMIVARFGAASVLLSKRFLLTQRAAVLRLVSIVLLFLVPFAIACVLDSPSPVRQYLAFSSGNKGNTVFQAMRYVAGYWEGGFGLLCGAGLVLAMVVACRRSHPLRLPSLSLLAAMLGGTLALLYYAKVGIDLLEFKYIGLFYYAVPAFAVALALLGVHAALRQSRARDMAAVLLSGAMLLLAFQKIDRSPEYLGQFNQPGVAGLYEALADLPSPHRLVLDLDNTVDWGTVWTHVLGVEAYAKRRNTDLFCVNQNWHISFTRAAICTPEELAASPRLFVRPLGGAPDPALGKPAVEGLGLGFYRVTKPDLALHSPVTVGERAAWYSAFILQSGWSTIEPGGFVWSMGGRSDLGLHFGHAAGARLQLDLEAFLPRQDSRQEVTIEVGGKPVASAVFTQQDNRKQVAVPVPADAGNDIVVTLHVARPISPKEAGVSPDGRVLGVRLFGITLEGN